MARITTVNKSMKDQTCGRCGKELPKGSAYRWAKPGFRSRTRLIRCVDCAFRGSELTTSNKSIAYAAQENGQDDLDGWDRETAEDLESIRDAVVEGANECLEQYQSAQDAWGDISGGAENEEWAEYISALESWVDELGGWEPEEYDEDDAWEACKAELELADDADLANLTGDELTDATEFMANRQSEWADEQAQALQEIIDGLEL